MKNNADESARLEARLNAALRRFPDAPVPSNFTARVLGAIDLAENDSVRLHGWNWHFLFPRVAVAAAVLLFAGVSIDRYEVHSQRIALVKNLALVTSTQTPSVDALENLDAIQGMSQSGHADNDLLAALQ